jgi:hypothetical protein
MDKKFQIGEIDDHILHLPHRIFPNRQSGYLRVPPRRKGMEGLNDYLGSTRVLSMHRDLRGEIEGKVGRGIHLSST